MSVGSAADAAAAAAAAKAGEKVVIEIWTLYAIAVLVVVLRTYARIVAVGVSKLRADDYLVWVGLLFYTAQSALGYNVGVAAKGFANNGMSDAERKAMSPDDTEYHLRVLGSKIQLAGWSAYSVLIFAFKLSMLAFYTRLMEGLGRKYRIRIYLGFGLVVTTFVVSILVIFAGCRPFDHYWQIYPDPGNACQPAISGPIVWTTFASNLSSDLYLIWIPLPMLWGSTLRTIKKVATTLVLGMGIFVLVCAMLKSIFVLVDPVNGAQLAGSWGIREAFTAVITTNLPMIFPLFKNWLKPWLNSALGSSSKKTYHYNAQSGFHSLGGGNTTNERGGRGGTSSVRVITGNPTLNDSEERIVDDVKLQSFRVTPLPGYEAQSASGIMVSNQVEIIREEVRSKTSSETEGARAHEAW